MSVVWKRPDGFRDAEPKDFKVVDIGEHARLWLHKKDADWFPFRISGGWQDEIATQRLNQLVNLIGKTDSRWVARLVHEFNHSMNDDAQKFYNETTTWLNSLEGNLKGDTWEVEIMSHAVREVIKRVNDVKKSFLTKSK